MPAFSRIALLAAGLLVVVVLGSCSSSNNVVPNGAKRITSSGVATPGAPQAGELKPSNGLVQSSDAGSVTIDMKWSGAQSGLLVFNVTMDTHSVDLDGYDLGVSSLLRDDGGNEYRPQAWDSAPGGHHRTGTLAFPLPDSLAQGSAKYVEMAVKQSGEADRVFKWTLQ